MDQTWFLWARRLAAIAQTGLTYAPGEYDRERYEEVREIAAAMMAALDSRHTPREFMDLFVPGAGYATPKVDVRAAVFRDGHILLVREREDGLWTLPGGWADVGDAPSVAAVREVKEESGFDVTARKLLMAYDRDRHGHPPIPFHAYKLFFLCDLAGGAATPSNETSDVDFFAEDNIPPLSLTRVTAAQIQHIFEHVRHPEWPTTFD